MSEADAPSVIRYRETPKQAEFVRAVLSGRYRHLLYGGAAGGGKSYVLCATIMLLCRMFPGSRWAIVRADLPRLKKTVIPTWNKIAPRPFFGEINRSDWYVRAENGSEVLFLPASEDIDPDFERIRGIELNGAGIEECDEVSKDFADVLSSRLGRWTCPGTLQPTPVQLYSCNPNQKWPKTVFYQPWSNGTLPERYFYLPATVNDNPYLSAEYLDQLRALPEKLRSVYFDGKWEYADQPDQLIRGEWVELAFTRPPNLIGRLPALGVDVARYGDDDSVVARTEAWHLAEIEAWNGYNTKRTADFVRARAVLHQIPGHMIRVDTVGLGAGVADNLRESKPPILCTEFIAGAKQVGMYKHWHFRNLRSEAWWNIRELLDPEASGPKASFGALSEDARRKLTADLVAQRYTMDNDKVIELVPKDVIKKELGRSPDLGDGVMQAYAKMVGPGAYMDLINTR